MTKRTHGRGRIDELRKVAVGTGAVAGKFRRDRIVAALMARGARKLRVAVTSMREFSEIRPRWWRGLDYRRGFRHGRPHGRTCQHSGQGKHHHRDQPDRPVPRKQLQVSLHSLLRKQGAVTRRQLLTSDGCGVALGAYKSRAGIPRGNFGLEGRGVLVGRRFMTRGAGRDRHIRL